jgi:hypothetical protein
MGISGTIALIGLGVSAAGAIGSASNASDQAAIQGNIASAQGKIQEQQAKAMELDARRKQLEVFRNTQRARAVSLSNATNQGAQLGSGLQGGYGQISGESNSNLLGIFQGLQTGRVLSGLNQQISGYNGQLSQTYADAAMYQGMTSLGGAMIQGAGTIGNLTSGWGGPSYAGAGYYGGSPSSNPNLVPYNNPGNTSLKGIY